MARKKSKPTSKPRAKSRTSTKPKARSTPKRTGKEPRASYRPLPGSASPPRVPKAKPIGAGRELRAAIKGQASSYAQAREHKRHMQTLPVRIFRRGTEGFDFHASMEMRDISVGGVYLKSTFYLKLGAQVDVAFEIPDSEHGVEVRGKIVNVIDVDSAVPGQKPPGFAIQFLRYYGDSEIYLRAFLTRGDMHEFVRHSGGAMFPDGDRQFRLKLVEFLVRWQIYQESLERADAESQDSAGGR